MIIYRMIIVGLLYAADSEMIRENAKLTTTATAAVINLIVIIFLNKVRHFSSRTTLLLRLYKLSKLKQLCCKYRAQKCDEHCRIWFIFRLSIIFPALIRFQLFLLAALFVALSSFNPASVISLLHASFHLRFARPLLLLFLGISTSSILLTTCSSFILLTWPYHFSCFSIIFLDACTILVVPLMCSFRILSLIVTPHIHLSILISFSSRRASCHLVVAQVSAPYNRAGLTTVVSTFCEVLA